MQSNKGKSTPFTVRPKYLKKASDIAEDINQSEVLRNTNADKVYQGEQFKAPSDRFNLISEAYDDMFRLQGSLNKFNDLAEYWISNGYSVEDIKRQIQKDLNYEPSIDEVEYIMGRFIETKASSNKIKYRKAYKPFMQKVASACNTYRLAKGSWQIKAYKEDNGQERMYLVRIEENVRV